MQKKFRLMMGAAALVAGSLAFAGAADAAPHGIKVGTLTCNVRERLGLCVRFLQGPALHLPSQQPLR